MNLYFYQKNLKKSFMILRLFGFVWYGDKSLASAPRQMRFQSNPQELVLYTDTPVRAVAPMLPRQFQRQTSSTGPGKPSFQKSSPIADINLLIKHTS